MNPWIQKSIKLANSERYLDKLFPIYPIEPQPPREVPEKIKKEIKEAFNNVDKLKLTQSILELPRSPIDNPYIASLKEYPDLLDKNPDIVKKIGEEVLEIAVNKILNLAAQPKRASRQLGPVFKRWVQQNVGYRFVEEKEFMESKEIVFLEGSDKDLVQFTIKRVISDFKGSIDLLFKIKDKVFVGQAKFLSGHGGHQNKQFNEAIKVAEIKKKDVIGIAILDGILWFESNKYMSRKIREFDGIALSALLLKEFIRSLE